MRWLVEVTSIGKTDCQSFVVDAESWQKALQLTRGLRGESGPMSGFSIELLEAGFRAVDPMARLIYVVKRAADDVPLSVGAVDARSASLMPRPLSVQPPATEPARAAPAAASAAPAAVSVAPAGAGDMAAARTSASTSTSTSGPPRPASHSPSNSAQAASKKKHNQTLVFASDGAAALQQTPVPAIAPPPMEDVIVPSAPNTERELPTEHETFDPAPAPVSAPASQNHHLDDGPTYIDKGSVALAGGPASQVIFKREQDPNDASPLTYREYVFAVVAGTPPDAAERVLRGQLELVRKAIGNHKAGKLVNLAVFDVVFQGKPPVPPLATLVWKDWRGTPVVDFPRQRAAAIAAERAASPPAPAPPAPASPAVSAAPIAVSEALGATSVAPAAPTASAAPTAAPSAFSQAPELAPGAMAFTAAAPLAAKTASPPPALWGPPPVDGQSATAVAIGAQTLTFPVPAAKDLEPAVTAMKPSQPQLSPYRAQQFTPNPDRPSRTPGPFMAPPRGRARGDELITALFEAMHDLHFLRDAIEGAEFCLGLALETLPSRAGIVHLYDINRREFVIAFATGAGTEKLLTKRHTEGEPLLASAMRKRRAVVLPNAVGEADAKAERFDVLGGAKSLIVAPVMQSGRFLGAIEIINPLDNAPFTEDEGAAVNYIAEQYAEFVAARGVIIDPDRISLRPSTLPK